MTLHSVISGSGPRLVLAHGFTQNGRCWGSIPEALAVNHEVVLIDAPGHGESRHDDADLWEASHLTGQVGGRAHYVGYSMGGRMLLHLVLQRPDLVESLTLIGASAGLEDEAERQERLRRDESLAEMLVTGRLEPFLRWWLDLPLFGDLTAEQAHFSERLTNRLGGVADSLIHCGLGTQESLWSRLAEIECPTLIVVGENDEKFTEIGQRLVEAIGANATMRTIESAGHSCHLERPQAFTKLLVTRLGSDPNRRA